MKSFLITLLFLLLPSWANDKCAIETQVHKVSPNEVILGVTLTPVEGWHTYWSNPGQAGLALSIELEDAGVKVLAEDFPVPTRYEFSGIVTYGYSKAATFLYSLSGEIPENLKGTATWLVCDDSSCLPADGVIDIAIGKRVEETTPEWVSKARAVQPEEIEVTLNKTISFIEKQASYIFTASEDLSGWTVYPYDNEFSEIGNGLKVEKVKAPTKSKTAQPDEATEDSEEVSEPVEKTITGPAHKITFKVIGDRPENPSFLLTNGEKAYKISL